jgi:tetratricopeptide (TPR) repeat protein
MNPGRAVQSRPSRRFRLSCLSCLLLVSCGNPTDGERPAQPPRSAREEAFRANNRGVAFLEQYAFDSAISSFEEALAVDPSQRLAAINLPIALFYANRSDEAQRAAAAAQSRFPDAPRPPYVQGLIARAENRLDQADAAFRRVLEIDPDDVGAKVNLALVYLQQRRYDEAVRLCEAVLAAEPYNATALYNLGQALTRSGRTAEGSRALQRFEALRDTGYAVTYEQAYLQQGRYAEALASSGVEPELVSREPPAVVFAAAGWIEERAATPASQLPGRASAAVEGDAGPRGGVTLADLDGDGDLDVISAAGAVRVWRNDRPRLSAIDDALGLAATEAVAALAADYDNDSRPDVLLLTTSGPRLFRQTAEGRFQPAPAALPAAAAGPVRTAAFADVDHDGDLDLLLGGASVRLLRNNGTGAFADITAASGLGGIAATVAVAATDFDNRRDVDLVAVSGDAAPRLMRNLRDGSFADVAAAAGLPAAAPFAALAAGDVNNDGFTDFFFGFQTVPGTWAVSDGRGRFQRREAPTATAGAVAAQLIDLDNDGLADLVAATREGVRAFRNLGSQWDELTDRLFQPELAAAGAQALASGDLDLDGDIDLVVQSAGTVRAWRNDGGSRNASLRVGLVTRVSNRSAVGARVELRAGSLYRRAETAAAVPSGAPADIVFGLGARGRADTVRVLWPSGILQAEPAAAADGTAAMTVTELNRKPSSCPYLFTWNGSRFEFVTDFLGGGEMGYWEAPGQRNVPDPIEYVRISGEQLQPRDGRLELRITNELEEALFADRLELLAIDHPRGVNVYPNEGLTEPAKPFRLYAVTGERPPARALDEHGHDVTAAIASLDRRYADDFTLAPLRGYAREHALTLDLGDSASATGTPPVLLLTGWTDYAFSSDNVAAHQAGLTLTPPALLVQDAAGGWRQAIDNVGVPVGRPQTVAVDLAGALRPGERVVRLVTSMRIYWDQILVAATVDARALRQVRLEPRHAALAVRGFSAEVRPAGAEPPVPDYAEVRSASPWKAMPGRYTRAGDVLPLLTASDDMFVVAAAGDEIALSFDAAAAGPVPDGWTRTFLLAADGFSKEMDINSASPDALAPLPFHGMTRYPYRAPERYPSTPAHRRYLDAYNTRIVAAPLPRLIE